jgi:nitronate monooxygenase
MNNSRRRFLTYEAGIGASSGIAEGATAQERVSSAGCFALSERTKELLASFGLKYPILQAPVGFASGPDLVIAVCRAGAMGSMALTGASSEDAKERVKKVLSATNAPFAVNYILAFDPRSRSLAAALDAGAPVVQFSWGIPQSQMVALIHSAGAKFGVQVASAEGASAALDAGADYLVCQGIEAGGHVQASSPLSHVLASVLPVARGKPIFAAGGIANGAGIRRALQAGASGASLGTRFVATEESYAHPEYKQALVRADATQTALTVCFEGGWPNALHRSLRNETFCRWEAAGCPPTGARPGEGDVLAKTPDGSPVLRYAAFSPSKAIMGDRILECALHAGLGVGDIKDIPAAGDLVQRLFAECETASG